MKRALYLSHTGMTEPLGRSQVLPYVEGLARSGWEFDLIGFEPPASEIAEVAALTSALATRGITYHALRRSVSHSPIVKVKEMAAAFARAVEIAVRRRPRIIHARSDLPALVGDTIARITPGSRFVFDCRGLLADEYADSGHWSRTSLRYRGLKRAERHLYRHANAVVTLTDALVDWLRHERMTTPAHLVRMIPSCDDLEQFRPEAGQRNAVRAQLAVGDRFVLGYSGNLGSYYCAEQMAELYAALRRQRPSLFLILTRADASLLAGPLARLGVPSDEVRCLTLRPSEVNAHLQAADAGVCFRLGRSRLASSPVKMAEYLALGLPVVMNRGIGDGDRLLDGGLPLVDAGNLARADLERAAAALAQLPIVGALPPAVALARREFDLNAVGITRYQALYDALS